VGDAYAIARELLREAEAEAEQTRADADRYVQQRQREAELVVAKARRLLSIAEERAAAMDAGAFRLPAADEPATIDLTEAQPPAPAARGASALDSILATAVSRAVERALPADR
jgi:hypothetical protein